MKYIFLFLGIFYFTVGSAQDKNEMAIRNAMQLQVDAWNSGDLEKFMSTYWQDDSLMFIGKSGVTYGWKNTLNNYKKGYPDKESMGTLSLDIIQVKKLSVIYYYITGKWHLARREQKGDLSGHYTLLFKKFKNKWLIISDHSS